MNITYDLPTTVDDRGYIKDLLTGLEVDAVSLITMTRDSVRGNHYHKETLQWLYLLEGKLRVVTQMPDEEPERALMRPGGLLHTPRNERHAVEAMEDSKFIVMTRGPRGGANYETDTYRLDTPLISP